MIDGHVTIVGMGKIGLGVGSYFAHRGAKVVGLDIDAERVAEINAGVDSTGLEPGVDEHLAELASSGTLQATTDAASAIAGAAVVLVAVPLMTREGTPDFTHLDAAVSAMAPHLRDGAVVVFETTLPVGTTRERFAPVLRSSADTQVAMSPERVSSGTIWRDLERYPKLVGGVDSDSTQSAAKFYRSVLAAEVWELESAEAAEMAKLAETTYRDLNIAFANEIARFAAEWDVDVVQVIEAANSQPYSHIHRPGIGVGGHCIPHYPHLLQNSTSGSELVRVAREINVGMPAYAVELLRSALGELAGKSVVLLGLAYRGGVKESADSPTFRLVELLGAEGVVIHVDDPLYTDDEIAACGFEPWDGRQPDAFVLVTDHQEYRDFAWKSYAPSVLIDGRNALERDEITALGHTYLGIGR